MKPAQITLLAVAVLAGGLAFFLLMRGERPTPQQAAAVEVTQEAKTQVLVAKVAIGMGEHLTPDALEWQDWPVGAIRSEYVTISAMPDAPAQLTDAVARFEFFPGEPIREAKLVRTDQGYLSAVLAKGMRGVSVPVDASSSAGGFIVPNDHVDVILTESGADGETSKAILSNVRILAIGKRLGELGASGGQIGPNGETGPQAQVFDNSTIATLELDPGQSETLINAKSKGKLSLALRSITDFNDNTVAQTSNNQAVRLIRYGKQSSVMSSNSASDALAAMSQFSEQPAALVPSVGVSLSPVIAQ